MAEYLVECNNDVLKKMKCCSHRANQTAKQVLVIIIVTALNSYGGNTQNSLGSHQAQHEVGLAQHVKRTTFGVPDFEDKISIVVRLGYLERQGRTSRYSPKLHNYNYPRSRRSCLFP